MDKTLRKKNKSHRINSYWFDDIAMNSQSDIIHVPTHLVEFVRKQYNKSDNDIANDLEILYAWWRKQPHLPFIKDDAYLERLVVKNKFRVEQTKRKIDAYFTIKGNNPDFFKFKSTLPLNEDLKNCLQSCYIFPLKNPTVNAERVWFFGIRDKNLTHHFNLKHLFIIIFMMQEILNDKDYCMSMRTVIDMKNFSLSHMAKMEPTIFIKGMLFFQQGFSNKFAGVDYINTPTFMDLIISLAGNVIPGNKLRVHNSLDELYTQVSQKCLPEEYGGNAGKLEDIQDAWIRELGQKEDFLRHQMSLISDESKRVDEANDDGLFGSNGTFKKLNID